jgi:hypothetical protein
MSKSHFRYKDLIPKSIYISPYQKAKAKYRAKELGSPILPKDKQELKELIDQQLSLLLNK